MTRPTDRPLAVAAAAADGRAGAAPRQVADDRRGLQGAVAGVPRHLDLEDPLSRGPEAADAAAHARRLPALLGERRVAPAHDPAPAARRVPAAAGDPPGARGRPHARSDGDRLAAARLRRARPGAALRRLTFSLRDQRRAVLARGRGRGDRRGAPRWSPSSRTSGSSRASCAATCATTTRPSARSSAPSPSCRATGSPGATCACSRRRPSASPALLQQILAPSLRSRNPERRKEAVEALENLAAVASHLKHLLLVRDLRRIAK